MLGGALLDSVGWDEDALGAVGLSGDPGTAQLFPGPDGPVIVAGLGDEVDEDTLRNAAGAAARVAPRESVLVTSLHRLGVERAVWATAQGFRLGSYSFDAYRSGEKDPWGEVILLGDADPAQLEEARALTTAVGHARDWVNRPSADKAPARLAEEMAAVLVGVGYEVEIWDEARIAAERLGGVQAVAAGSDRPPTVLVGRRRSGSQSPIWRWWVRESCSIRAACLSRLPPPWNR